MSLKWGIHFAWLIWNEVYILPDESEMRNEVYILPKQTPKNYISSEMGYWSIKFGLKLGNV